MDHEITVEKLRNLCDPQSLQCRTSEELKATKGIIGQERASRSLQFGLDIKALGFNIYIAGLPGTGRTTAVKRFLEQVGQDKPVPVDWVYVTNFRDPSQPNAIQLPPGRGLKFQKDMKTLIQSAQHEVRTVFDSDEYAHKREETARIFQQQKEEIEAHVGTLAQQSGFILQASPMGIVPVPAVKGRTITEEEFLALSQEAKEELARKQQALQDEIETAIRQAKNVSRKTEEELFHLDQQVASYALAPLLEDVKKKYRDVEEILSFLDEVRSDILENLPQIRGDVEEKPPLPIPVGASKIQLLKRYAVNILVDNTNLKGAPVVIELNPTYNNLFGRVDSEAQFGTLVTDFTMIRQGSLHRANGGYLVIPTEELLRNPFTWDSLKRALRNQQIVIEDASERLGFMTTRTLKPEPIPLRVKVVLIGQPTTYHLLLTYDEDFRELFKVKADFASVMDRTEASVNDYTVFVSTVCSDGDLKHLDCTALAKIIEHGSRLAEDQMKLSTRFGEIADVIREASYYATQENEPYVKDTHIQRAIDEKYYRSSLIQERMQEMTARGLRIIDVQGEKVGTVNGLSVIDMGDIAFGQPSRITASVGVGREGLIDIEREAELGGPTHTKGVLILAGYLTGKYAQDKPLSLSARLVFEQSYSGVEGDSASSTELYALLSELSGLPIRQGIAVTGSVNQKGEVQAIGGVNEKTEGFFELCKSMGFTGQQGVMIPASNIQNLMLKEELVNAVKEGKFHVWSVNTIDEGIEILTGVKAGLRTGDGCFEQDTVNDRVNHRLKKLAETLVQFGKEGIEPEAKDETRDETAEKADSG